MRRVRGLLRRRWLRRLCARLARVPAARLSAELREAELVILLHLAQIGLELLVAVLELLDRAGELAHLFFQLVEPHQEVGRGDLRMGGERAERAEEKRSCKRRRKAEAGHERLCGE